MYKNLKKITILAAVLMAWTWLVYRSVLLYSADRAYSLSRDFASESDLAGALETAQFAVSLSPRNSLYLVNYARVLAEFSHEKCSLDIALVEDCKEASLDVLSRAHEMNPHNLRMRRDSLHVYYLLATGCSREEQVSFYEEKASSYFNLLKDSYPLDVGLLVDVYGYEKLLDFEEAKPETLRKIRILRPNLLEWYPLLL
jgi:hypothetical protein